MTKAEQLAKCKDKAIDLMDKSIVVRFDKRELRKRVVFCIDKEICQVCETSKDLDYPHHGKSGISRKDDRFLVCICVTCHRTIHQKGFSTLPKSREEIEDIGWENHLEIEELENEN